MNCQSEISAVHLLNKFHTNRESEVPDKKNVEEEFKQNLNYRVEAEKELRLKNFKFWMFRPFRILQEVVSTINYVPLHRVLTFRIECLEKLTRSVSYEIYLLRCVGGLSNEETRLLRNEDFTYLFNTEMPFIEILEELLFCYKEDGDLRYLFQMEKLLKTSLSEINLSSDIPFPSFRNLINSLEFIIIPRCLKLNLNMSDADLFLLCQVNNVLKNLELKFKDFMEMLDDSDQCFNVEWVMERYITNINCRIAKRFSKYVFSL